RARAPCVRARGSVPACAFLCGHSVAYALSCRYISEFTRVFKIPLFLTHTHTHTHTDTHTLILEMSDMEPKSAQDLTVVVQSLLQQMQDKFQTMSDQIIGRIDDMSTRIDDLEETL
ncbi:hypothetical protein AMELA_G00131760, partial [Ameiurus melas]